MYKDFCFVLDLIQIIINIVTLGCIPNIHLELNKAFFQEFLQSRTKNNDERTFIETCYDQNSISIKDHTKLTHLHHWQMQHFSINNQSWKNLVQANCNNHTWIWWLHTFHLKHLRIETRSRENLIQAKFNNRAWIWWLHIFIIIFYLLEKRHTNNLKNSNK